MLRDASAEVLSFPSAVFCNLHSPFHLAAQLFDNRAFRQGLLDLSYRFHYQRAAWQTFRLKFPSSVYLVATLIIIQYRRRPRYINNNRKFHLFFGTLGLAAVLFNHRSVRDKGGSGEQRDGNDEDVLKHPITVRHVHILLQKTSACPSSTRPTWNKRCLVDRSMRQRRDPSRTIIRKRRLQ